MTTYALDTNVIIDYLRGNEKIKNNMRDAYLNDNVLAISSIVYYEVYRGFVDAEETKKFKKFQSLCYALHFFYLDKDDMKALKISAEIYNTLRKSGNLIEDNDIFIAAAAMANGATLVTDNVKHFERVEGLAVVNWKE